MKKYGVRGGLAKKYVRFCDIHYLLHHHNQIDNMGKAQNLCPVLISKIELISSVAS